MKNWKPTVDQFDQVVDEIFTKYATTAAAHDALEAGDEVLAHSILFVRDSLFFWEFCDAIRDADVGRMWVVYDFWVFMMRGAGCHNYGNEILEMKAQFEYEYPPLLCHVIERTWLVNWWGKKGCSIPTDLYLEHTEHNNGFTKNMFAALGSCAFIEHIQEKSSACVEILRKFAHEVSGWFHVWDFHYLAIQNVHVFTRNRKIYATGPTQQGSKKKEAVWDILKDGLQMLSEKNMFDHWKDRTGTGGTDLYVADPEGGAMTEEDNAEVQAGFADANGTMEVDCALDPDLEGESPFSNIRVNELASDDS
ncbi:hypothetical protein B0H34DRAFT_670726 [Crassisporium funariophilum]|nr:hypothetical protein B0H34DRAFT_670726 [Crassisporium funariophilum]